MWTIFDTYDIIKQYYSVTGETMNSIKWLFFDLGSTLIDETECIKKRCNNIIEKNNIDKDEFYIKVRECAKTNSYAVKTAAEYYGVNAPRWYGELEKLYSDVDDILYKLSQKYKLESLLYKPKSTYSMFSISACMLRFDNAFSFTAFFFSSLSNVIISSLIR